VISAAAILPALGELSCISNLPTAQ
jgi:hypothetical protein